jgi:C4-dicarboxylate-specific signal transduction histidine kinase
MDMFDDNRIETLLMTAWLGLAPASGTSTEMRRTADTGQREQDIFKRSILTLTRAMRISRLGLLATTITHEITQPLAAIRLNGETGLRWLDKGEPDLTKARTLFERIMRDATRALDIVDLIRMAATGRITQQVHVTLDEVVGEAMAAVQDEAHSNGVVLAYHPTAPARRVFGNKLQLEQLVINLLINAVQALASVPPERRTIIITTSELANNLICCTIEDNGHGIDPLHFPRLFDDVFTTKVGGMGLGLFISKSIVSAHGGCITADNTSSLGGARLTFTLPMVTDDQ